MTRATVIDATGAPPQRDMTLVVDGDRIAAIGGPGATPPGARLVDVHAKFVIPGLWDMHTHTGPELIYLPLYVANGVTGIREMWGRPAHHLLRTRIDAGGIIGPRMVISSAIIDGPSFLRGATVVTTDTEARQAVRAAKHGGADFIKVYSGLSRQAYAAIANEAAQLGLPVAGHLPDLVSADEASDAGQRSMEHLLGMFVATSSQQAELRQRIDAFPFDPARPSSRFEQVREQERLAAASYNPESAARLFARFARNNTWHCPTLRVRQVKTSPPSTFANDPRLRYLPFTMKESWRQQRGPSTPEEVSAARDFFRAHQRMVDAMSQAGVGVLAGTDCSNPYCLPGFGLHDELSLLVTAGLTPIQALQSATRDAARYLGLESSTGTVTVGKTADLVILDANPLEDITNIQRIHAVLTAGRLITRQQREQLLTDVEAAANSPSSPATMPAFPCRRAGPIMDEAPGRTMINSSLAAPPPRPYR